MNKNLKKVISAVAALALSVSSFAALTVSAANYPDVPADADYAHAVDELTALDIVVGDDQGNFNPDSQVTRAEFAKMVVCALGPAKAQMAESAANQTSVFPDVRDVGTGSQHWASGYITALTGDGIISGFDDGLFRPDDNVSYVQAMKMLACSAGYDTWAKQRGEWPNNYLSVANELGIGDGVVVGNDTALTRAQCALMVANTLRVPVLVQTGKTNWDGTPELAQKNKTGINWQSILTKNHDAYVVNGRVTETSKTASGTMDYDEVRFQVERATNFEDEYYKRGDDPIDFIANVGDTDAANQLRVYSEAIVRVNANDEYELICLQPLSSNAEVTFAAADFDDENSAYRTYDNAGAGVEATGRIYATVEGSTRTTSYKLEAEDGQYTGSYYVNGVDVTNTIAFSDFVENYITNNDVGEVTLVSESSTGSTATSGNYNTIMVTYYEDAIVESVDADETEAEIYFLDFEEGLDDSLAIDYEDEEVDVSIVKSGAKIDAADINPYDVVSIAYDVTVNFADSTFYDVIVSDHENWEGKGNVRTRDGLEYQLDGTYYTAVDSLVASNLDRQTTYVWYFDNFGRIAYTEEVSSDKNLAIVDNIYESNDGETMYVRLIYKDGTSGTVSLGQKLDTDATVKEIREYIFANGENARDGRKDPQDRVITYRVNTSNELTQIDYIGDDYKTVTGEYKEASNRIGQYTFSEATATLVVSEDGDDWEIKYLDPTTLINEEDYTAYFYDRSSSGIYSLAIVKDTSGGWSKNTQMAAYVSTVTTSDENYEYAIELYTADDSTDVTTLYLSDDYFEDAPENFVVSYRDLENGLAEGTPILYTTDSSGAITSVRTVFDQTIDGFIDGNYDELTGLTLNTTDLQSLIDTSFKSESGVDSDERYGLVFGLVTGKYSGQVDFVTQYKVEDVKIDGDDYTGATTADTVGSDVDTYALTDQTAVYVYDYNGQSRYNTLITEGGTGNVRATSFNSRSWADGSDDTKAVMDVVSKPQYAVARILGDDIMEIMVFVPEK